MADDGRSGVGLEPWPGCRGSACVLYLPGQQPRVRTRAARCLAWQWCREAHSEGGHASLALPPAASRPPAGAPLCCPARALPAGRPAARSKVTLLRELDDKTLYLLASKMTPFRYSPACPSRNPAFVLGGLFPCSLLANAWAKSKGA